MIKSALSLQDLRRGIYIKAKAEQAWRFWGLYVHVCKMESLERAYKAAKQNNGAPGIDGVTFAAIEQAGLEGFLQQIRQELIRNWVEKKVRRHLMRSRQCKGFGWKRWSSQWIYKELGLFNDYHVRRPKLSLAKAIPAR